jgi:hypothetical protein
MLAQRPDLSPIDLARREAAADSAARLRSLDSFGSVGRRQPIGAVAAKFGPARLCRREGIFDPLADLLALMLRGP